MAENRSASASTGGVSTLGLLGVLFVGLKLTGVIDWSWWLVLLPFYIGLVLVGVFVLVAFLWAGASHLNDKRIRHQAVQRYRRRR